MYATSSVAVAVPVARIVVLMIKIRKEKGFFEDQVVNWMKRFYNKVEKSKHKNKPFIAGTESDKRVRRS